MTYEGLYLNSNDTKFVCFITGASGVGKSTLCDQLRVRYSGRADITIRGFDTIGVPFGEEMIKVHGSPSEWQRAATKQWVTKVLQEVREPIVILERQVNLDFIYDAFEQYGFKNFIVVLLVCSEDEMKRRLEHERRQPELANENMQKWSVYLRKQAESRQVPVIYTGTMSLEAVTLELEKIIMSKFN
jgi:broad-specificity NMP kinase